MQKEYREDRGEKMVFLQGLLIGFAFVAPIGMQNIYVFNNGLTYRLQKALLYTFFVWVFDALFCVTAFYGIGALITRNEILKLVIMLAGGTLTVYIGYTIIRSAKQRAVTSAENQLSLKQALLTALIVSWANPQALIDGTMMLGASRGTLTNAESIFFIIGVVSASFIWDLGMTTVFNLFSNKLPRKFLLWVNLISGSIVAFYGLYLLLKSASALGWFL